MEVRYKFLLEADVEDKVHFNGVRGSLRDIIMSIKWNKALLFVGVE